MSNKLHHFTSGIKKACKYMRSKNCGLTANQFVKIVKVILLHTDNTKIRKLETHRLEEISKILPEC